DLVARELARVRADHGNQSIYGGSYGWGSSGRFHQPSNQIYRFLRLLGGYTDAKGTYSGSAAEAIVPHVLGMGYHAAVAAQTSWSVIAEHTELFVAFGGLRLSNAQVTFGGSGPHHTKDWLARCTNTEFVSVSPLADDGADFVDPRWMAIRPGTDVALMAGLLHTLIVENLVDEATIEKYCHGWSHLRDDLLGRGSAPARTAEWAAEVCGVEPGAIEALAREMASRRTMVSVSLSIQRGDHGEQSYWMAIALACALGGIGRPGEGFALGFGANGNAGAGQRRKRIPGPPIPAQHPDMPVISVSRVVELLEEPGAPFHFNGVTDTFPDIKLVYWAGGNIFHHHQDLNRLRQAWQRPETIVVHEPFWTPMARFADIVLPATTPLERNDLGGAETILLAMGAALPPQGQAKDDYAIFAHLAERLGLAAEFTQGRTADAWVEHLYEQFRADNPYSPPFEEFWEAGQLPHPDM
ncbi:MAG: molybdopterin-dependent oxidoreductase, partial [Actinomycetota bacterium]